LRETAALRAASGGSFSSARKPPAAAVRAVGPKLQHLAGPTNLRTEEHAQSIYDALFAMMRK
jgi:hypothetical protein